MGPSLAQSPRHTHLAAMSETEQAGKLLDSIDTSTVVGLRTAR
jgi:hypothetical protein